MCSTLLQIPGLHIQFHLFLIKPQQITSTNHVFTILHCCQETLQVRLVHIPR